jgi:hypothetical protein
MTQISERQILVERIELLDLLSSLPLSKLEHQ